MNKNSRIYVAGHTGFVGSAMVRRLRNDGYKNLILKTHEELDLRNSKEVRDFFNTYRPKYVFMCASLSGGVNFNIYNMINCLEDNISMLFNIIKCSHKFKVNKLVLFGSNCMYPKNAINPINERWLLNGEFEPTNEGFALAKASAIKLMEYYRDKHGSDFISVIPCNLYGIGDKFDANHSHLVSALIQKFHNAKEDKVKNIELWGTGTPLREFLYIDDCIDACMFIVKNKINIPRINIGYGNDISVKDIADKVARIVGYTGKISFDDTYPDGIKRKLLDSSTIYELGWIPKTFFEEGLIKTYSWFQKEVIL